MTKKLSLVGLAVLLAHCALPTDQNQDSTDQAATEGSAGDSREGLTAIQAPKGRARARSVDAVSDAIAYAQAAAEASGAHQAEFKVLKQGNDLDGLTHVRLQQIHEGLVVWGADSVVHVSPAEIVGMGGSISPRLSNTRTAVGVDERAILAKAKELAYNGQEVATQRDLTEKVVFVTPDGATHVAVHAAFYNEISATMAPADWNYMIDARTGDVLAKWNNLQSEVVQASGPGGNPKYVHSWNQELDVTPSANGTSVSLNTARLRTVDLRNGTSTQNEVVGTTATIGDAPINDAHGFAEVALNMMHDWQGRESIDDHGFQILSRVHYSRNYENAFWDPRAKYMTYGDGANTFYPLSGSVDVCAHEINHGFTTNHSNVAYSGQPGGLNEGFSDIAGKTAEWYYKGTANFDLGGDVFKRENAALRYMCNPTQDGRSIDNAANMRPSTDPHYSSGVPNKSFCRAAKRLSPDGNPDGTATQAGVKRASQAYYLANAQYWTSSSTFVQGCQGVVDAARALQYTDAEVAALKASWADVGVTCN